MDEKELKQYNESVQNNEPKHDMNHRRSIKKVSPVRKVFRVVKSLLVMLIVIVAASMMIFTIVSAMTFDRSNRDLFGYKAFIVRSDSMSATDFKAGDLILVREVDPSTLKEGDIISYISLETESYGQTVTHKIRSRIKTEDGSPAFITYGTTTGVDDAIPVEYEYILGKYEFALPGVGTFFAYLKTTPGYITCIFLPFLLLIIMQGINTVRLYQKYRMEQQEELRREKEQLEAQREELQRMAEELKQMQAKLALEKDTE